MHRKFLKSSLEREQQFSDRSIRSTDTEKKKNISILFISKAVCASKDHSSKNSLIVLDER